MPACRSDRSCRARGPITPLSHIRRSVVVAVATLLLSAVAPAAPAQTLKLAGSGNGVATMEVLAAAYRARETKFQLHVIQNLGSNGAIKALAARAIDVAVIGRDLKGEETALGLTAFEYGRTPLVLGTNRREPKGLSLQEAADLFAGRITHWPDGVPVRLVLRPPTDSDTVLQSAWSPAMKEALNLAHARPGMVIAPTDRQSADQMERLPGSLGSTTLALILAEHRDLRVVPIGGVVPSVKALADATYPYFKRMYLVTRGNEADLAQRFADFVRSGEGRAELTRIGHLVMSR